MKIIYFGTPEFSVKPLLSLYQDPMIEIVAVITQPDKPQGRKQILTCSPVKETAKTLNLKVIQPNNRKVLLEELKKLEKVDFFVVIAFGMILSKEILDMPKHRAINVHASLLPKYRGASPIQESILNGDSDSGISIMEMDEEMDHGKVYLLKRVKIDENETLPKLTSRLSKITAEILPTALKDIADKTLTPIPQNNSKATYCHKIEKEEGKIDFKKSAVEIKNMLRAFTPWPGVFMELNSKKLKIIEAETSETNYESGKLIIENKKLRLGTAKGSLIIHKLQMEGKNVMDSNAFINGYKSLIK